MLEICHRQKLLCHYSDQNLISDRAVNINIVCYCNLEKRYISLSMSKEMREVTGLKAETTQMITFNQKARHSHSTKFGE